MKTLVIAVVEKYFNQGSPFLKCVAPIWVLRVRGGEGGFIGLPGWFGALFFTFTRFAEGVGVQSYLCNTHIEPTHFKKGLPLLIADADQILFADSSF